MSIAARAHLYGKVRSLPEYIGQLGGEEPELTFGDVLDRAVGFAAHEGKGAWRAAYDAGAVSSFFFRPSMGSARVVLGALVPSQDSVGRPYPLMAVAPLTEEVTSAGVAYVPVAAEGFLAQAGDAVRAARAAGRVDAATPAVASLDGLRSADLREAAEDFADWAARPGLAPRLWTSLFPQGRAENGARAMQGLARIGSRVGGGTGVAVFARFPLGSGGAPAASFWLAAVARAVGSERLITCAFWSQEDGGSLFVALGREPPIDFWLRLWLPDGRDRIEALGDAGAGDEEVATLARSKEAKVAELLAQLPIASPGAA